MQELIKELEKLANDCRLQEKIETQIQLQQIIKKVKSGNLCR